MISISLDNIEQKLPHTEDGERNVRSEKTQHMNPYSPGVLWNEEGTKKVVSSLLLLLSLSIPPSISSLLQLANLGKNELQKFRINLMTCFLLYKMLLMSHFPLKTLVNISYLLIFTHLPFLNIRLHSSKHRRRCIILIKQRNSNPKQTVKCQRHLFDLCSPVDCTKCTEKLTQKQGGNAF